MNSQLKHQSYPKQVHDLVNLFEKGQLNLNPGFQRKSVWTLTDQKKLIDSVVRNFPIPAIFLYRRDEDGRIIYDVIDGKQRLESLFFFMGVIRGKRFSVKTSLNETKEVEEVDWKVLKRKSQQSRLTGYNIYTIEVDGTLSDIIDLFVRINSTGKALTSAEKQHAKFYNSPFLKMAAQIANKYREYFRQTGILSATQISRMKHVELVCELMVSIESDDVINKKAALDKVIGKGYTTIQLSRLRKQIIRVLNRTKSMFPDLAESRFKQLSDFYVLALLISKYENEGLVLTEKKRNRQAWEVLKRFSVGVDRVRSKQKQMRGFDESDHLFREYLLTVLQATDEISQRRKRRDILDGLLRSLFAVKDLQRGFSQEQRRLIWNTSENQTCIECGKSLTWDDFTIDHILPHSKGGRSDVDNAALMCRKHNSAKGNRRS